MSSQPVWDGDASFRVGGVHFVVSHDASTADRLCIRKPRALVEATVELVRAFDRPNVVEIGIAAGGSTALLALTGDPRRLVAIERSPEPVAALDALVDRRALHDRVHLHYGVDQADRARLAQIVTDAFTDAPLDLVIDDASHRLAETTASFETLFPRLRPGGVFVIEDWNWQLRYRYALALAGRAETGRPAGSASFAADAAGRAALAEYARENLALPPLETLALQLVLVHACSPDVVADVTIDGHWVVARRGPAHLDAERFRVVDHYVDGGLRLPRR